MNAAPDTSLSRTSAAKVQMVAGYVGISLSIVQGVVMVPMYLHYVGDHLYGLWLATGGITIWLSMLDLGISGLMGQRIASAYGRRDATAVCLYYWNGLLLQSGMTVVFAALSAVVAWLLPLTLTSVPSEIHVLRWATFMAAMSLAISFTNYGQKNTADALQRPFWPAVFNVLGSGVTIGTIATLLMSGRGLFALPSGMLIGSTIALLCNGAYVSGLVRHIGTACRTDSTTLRDMLRLSPAILIGRIGHGIVDRIEPTLLSWNVSPEWGVAFAVTKRAADIIQMVLDRVVGAVTAGFAHLYAERDMRKAAIVLLTVVEGSLLVGVVMLTTYVAANHGFVRLWVGDERFIGQTVTILIAASVFASFLNNTFSYLLGATGDIGVPSILMGAEAFVRVSLMAILLPVVGIAGLPIAVILSAGGFATVYAARLLRRLDAASAPRTLVLQKISSTIAALLAGFGVAWAYQPTHWLGFCALLAVSCVLAIALVWALDTSARTFVRDQLARKSPAAA